MATGRATAWIGLGGNRDDSAVLIHDALTTLRNSPGVEVVRESRLFRSPPWGPVPQADFVNAVAELSVLQAPHDLLGLLFDIEQRLGRRRSGPDAGPRWGPRCIDLDLLTYEDVQLHSEELELPHPRMHERAFVLVPLLEVAPEFVIPGVGPAAESLQRIDPEDTAAVVPLGPSSQDRRS